MTPSELAWIAATFHLPTTYSCRIPLSAAQSALITPAPGPATIRLACIRVGIELFGHDVMRTQLFPELRAATICIRPPEQVALSGHTLHAYKASGQRGSFQHEASIFQREMAHAIGPLTISLQLPHTHLDAWQQILLAIGYWGQAHGFTTCLSLGSHPPLEEECLQRAKPGEVEPEPYPLFHCILSEFRTPQVSWEEVMTPPVAFQSSFLILDRYTWPLVILQQTQAGILLRRVRLSRRSAAPGESCLLRGRSPANDQVGPDSLHMADSRDLLPNKWPLT